MNTTYEKKINLSWNQNLSQTIISYSGRTTFIIKYMYDKAYFRRLYMIIMNIF